MINFYEVKNLFCKNNSFSTIFDELTKVNKKPSDFSEGFCFKSFFCSFYLKHLSRIFSASSLRKKISSVGLIYAFSQLVLLSIC